MTNDTAGGTDSRRAISPRASSLRSRCPNGTQQGRPKRSAICFGSRSPRCCTTCSTRRAPTRWRRFNRLYFRRTNTCTGCTKARSTSRSGWTRKPGTAFGRRSTRTRNAWNRGDCWFARFGAAPKVSGGRATSRGALAAPAAPAGVPGRAEAWESPRGKRRSFISDRTLTEGEPPFPGGLSSKAERRDDASRQRVCHGSTAARVAVPARRNVRCAIGRSGLAMVSSLPLRRFAHYADPTPPVLTRTDRVYDTTHQVGRVSSGCRALASV